jgi:CRP/FNR family transcriptional regulator
MLKNAEIEQLCVIIGFKKAYKSEFIYFAEEPIKRIYFLKKGMIKIAETGADGNEIIKDIIQQGDLFGELGLNEEGENHEYAQAISTEVKICSFTLPDFEKVLEANPSVALSYTKMVGFKFKRLQNQYSNLVFKDVKTRLTQFLKDWAEKEGIKENNKVRLENYLTHQDIASLVCSTRQTVNQLINELQNAGKIIYSRKEIVIPDIKLL